MKDFSNSDKNCQQRTGVIYKITNLVNNMSYVGQTTQKLSKRIDQHKHGKVQLIDKAIQNFGWENFSHETLEICPCEILNEREKFWIGVYDCIAPKGYNKKPGGNGAGFKGRHHTEESLAKLSAASAGENNPMYGKHHTPETRAKMSAAKKGKTAWNKGKKLPPLSEEHKLKISASEKGRKFSEEHKAKISVANKGKCPSAESRAKMSAAQKGRKHTEESKAKMSAAHKGKTSSKETRAKMSVAQKGHEVSAETRAKKSLAMKKYWAEKKKNSEEGCEE